MRYPTGKRETRKPLKELYIDGKFTEEREDWEKELKRHCEVVFVDLEETREPQQERVQ